MQGIAMFLCGGFTKLAANASDAGNVSLAASYANAAASMIFIFTFTVCPISPPPCVTELMKWPQFGATWLTVPWLYPAEIFPLAVRAKGNAWGVVGWAIGNGWLVSSPSIK